MRNVPLVALVAGLAAAGLSCCVQPPPRPSAITGRPADAVAFGGHWYRAYDEPLSWQEARDKCRSMGGHLACVETEAEQVFIADLADGRKLFLGATDEKEEGTWAWVNGAPFTYTCWMEGQPNNYGGVENYLSTYDGGEWNDAEADYDAFWSPTGFICEWEK